MMRLRLDFYVMRLAHVASEGVRCGFWHAHLWQVTALEAISDRVRSHKWQPKSIVLVGWENVRKTEVVDSQRLLKMSIFDDFRTKILFTSKKCLFFALKIRNYFDRLGVSLAQASRRDNERVSVNEGWNYCIAIENKMEHKEGSGIVLVSSGFVLYFANYVHILLFLLVFSSEMIIFVNSI